MGACQHASWLKATRDHEIVLWDSGTLPRLVGELTNPAHQYPSVLLFVGRKNKDTALRELFPCNNLKKSQRDGIASLRVDTLGLKSPHPLLFAESDPLRTGAVREDATAPCHETTSFPCQWQLTANQTLFDVVHARIFCLFADILCLFVDDFPDFDDVLQRLWAWAALGRHSVRGPMVRPQVILVKKGAGSRPSAAYDLFKSEYFQRNLAYPDLTAAFSSITVLHVAGEQISPLSRFRPLKELVQCCANEVRHFKQSIGCMYNALHLSCFFESVVRHTARTITEPFDFLPASREENPLDPDFVGHLITFFKLQCRLSLREKSIVVASAILMDAYPPGMHLFDPMDVFEHLYVSLCRDALTVTLPKPALVPHQLRIIRDRLVDHFVDMQVTDQDSATVHCRTLKKFQPYWSSAFSNHTDLCCLRRKPERVFTCGHSVCDVCVRILGHPRLEAEYTYDVDACVFCGSGSLRTTMSPPTTDKRLLSIDGGGCRGIVPLRFLAILQGILGADCPIQDLFDLAIGTSSGGLIILGLFLRHWTVGKCIETFDTLSREIFSSPQGQARGFWYRTRRLLRCWLSDGYYDAAALEATMKRHFGPQQRMFGVLASQATKVAVTATTISDASAVILSNYNGVKKREANCGYRHLRPRDVIDEPYVWEAGRATSAAPMLFPTTQLSTLGTFQDGGLKHNNPINLALWESCHIWPASTQPDLVLSLGTGTNLDTQAPSPSATNFRHVVHDGFVPRLWRWCMSLLDGEIIWRELWNRLDKDTRDRFFRANIYCIPDSALAIDNVDRMAELEENVYAQPHNHRFRTQMVFALMAVVFYFELDCLPFFQNGRLYCKGSIRSRLKGPVICRALSRVHPSDLIFMTDTEVLGYFRGDDDLCMACRRYSKHVEFAVRHADEPINLFLQSTLWGKRRISGFPHPMRWFQKQQYLDAHFGTPFHTSPRGCDTCSSSSPHRYSLLPKRQGGGHYSPDASAPKRRRL